MHLTAASFTPHAKAMLTCKQLHPTVQTADIFSLNLEEHRKKMFLFSPPSTDSVVTRIFIMGDQCLDIHHTSLQLLTFASNPFPSCVK